jgi:hypothetical protein
MGRRRVAPGPLGPPIPKPRRRWVPDRAVRNLLALHSLRWRHTKPGYDYYDYDLEVYRGKVFIAVLMKRWTPNRIIEEIELGLRHHGS